MLRKNNIKVLVLSLVLVSLFSIGLSAEVHAAPNDATLSDLTIDGVTVDGFAADVLSYDVTVDNTTQSIEIAALATDANAALSGDTGTQSLAVGLNTFTITCQSEDLSASNDYIINVTREASDNAYISYIRVDGYVIDGFSTDQYVYDINVEYNKDYVEIEAGAVHTEAVVSGDLGTQVLYAGVNALTITCTAEDGVTTKDYVINFTRAASSSTALTDFGFVPTEAALDPDRDIAYMTAQGGYSLYRADLMTGDITYLTFENRASNFVVANGKIYLALLHAEHSTSSVETGTIGVIDIASFTPTNFFDVAINPYDLVVDPIGTVYISNGMYTNNEAKSYDSLTGALLSTIPMDAYNYLDYNPVYNKLYSIDVGGSRHQLYAYDIVDGALVSYNSSPYFDEYGMNIPTAISPDGQFIFAGGNIFTCSATSAGDLTYFDTIENYDSICFDSDSGLIYIVDQDTTNYLLTYDAGLAVTNQFTAKYSFSQVFYSNNKLVYLQKKSYSDGYFFSLNPEESPTIKSVAGVTLDSDEMYLMPGDYQRLTQTLSPSDATNQHVTWTSSDPSIATYIDGEVHAHSTGTCQITVTTLDGAHTDTCTINVVTSPYIATHSTAVNGLDDLGFTPLETVLDSDGNFAYITDEDGDRLYKVNLSTGAVSYMQFIYNTDCLEINGDQLYVSLTRAYYSGGQNNSKVIVIDTNTFAMTNFIELDTRIDDIVSDKNAILYVITWYSTDGIIPYDTSTWTEYADKSYKAELGLWQWNALYQKLYAVDTTGTPRDMRTYEMVNGVSVNTYDSIYHGDYAMTPYIKISPDGNYIFNNSGNIFKCTDTRATDMNYYNAIDTYTDMCFDIGNNKFYTCYDNILKEYNYGTQLFTSSEQVEDAMHHIFFANNKLIAMQIDSSGHYYFNTITSDDYITPYVSSGVLANNGLTNLGFVPKDTAIDTTGGMAYVTEADGKRLYQVDLSDGSMQYMEFIYTAESLTVRNGKVYVSLLHQPHQNSDGSGMGTIAVVDASSFTMSDYFVVEIDPSDIEVDSSGVIYLSPGSNTYGIAKSYNSVTGQMIDAFRLPDKQSIIDYNDTYNKLYAITTRLSPRDIEAFEMTNGAATDDYEMVYHGDYILTTDISISPDGHYIFNGSGNIFASTASQTGDMVYNGTIDAFDYVCYDLANNHFFTAQNNVLKVYNYDTRTITKTYTDKNVFEGIYFWNNTILALKQNDASNYYFDTTTGTGINVTAVTADDAEVVLGETADLNVVITPSDATNKTVFYSSSNESVATVDASGTVTGIATGTATITVRSQDGAIEGTCTVTVAKNVTGVELDVETANIVTGVTGYTLQLNATVLPNDAGNQNVTFESSNEAVATVDNTGLVTAVDDGSVTITVTTEEGGFTDTCTVNVEISLVKGIYSSSADGLTDLGFVPHDSAVDANGNYAYLTETDGDKLYRVNLSTGQVDYMEFRYKAESIDINNGQIYVALLTMARTPHSSADVGGVIAVIDEATFTYSSHFEINTDPWDIETDNYGYIYISPGSGGSSNFSAYHIETGTLKSYKGNVKTGGNLVYNAVLNKLYMTMGNSSPVYLIEWQLSAGSIMGHSTWEYTDEHGTTPYTSITSDYKYLFNGSGTIYTSSYDDSNDMKYYADIDPFSSICFDINSNVFYTASGNTLTAYDYYTREAINTHTAADEFIDVYYAGNNLIALNKNASDEYYFGLNTQSTTDAHKVAIIFGMAAYQSPTTALNGPVNDVRALKEVLEFSGYEVYVYNDRTSVEMLNYTYLAASNMAPDNTLLFAYSGHGADGGYLFGIDSMAVSINDLENRLSMHTGVKEVLIDACYSGDFIAKDMEAPSPQITESGKSFNDYIIEAFGKESTMMSARSLDQSGYLVITASTGDQLSYEYLFNLSSSPYAQNNLHATTVEGNPYYWMGYFSAAFDDGFGLFNEVPLSKAWADENEDGLMTWHEIYTYAAAETDDMQQVQVYPENSDHVLCNISNVLAEGVTVDDAQVDIGGTQQLTVTFTPADTTYQNVTYQSSDESIVTVDAYGVVTGVSFGSATITVTSIDGGHTDTCTVTSGYYVESVAVTPETLNMGAGETVTLTAEITPSNATNQSITWTSSDESVATVDAIGMVWAHSTGTATITATTQDGGHTDTCEVTVVVPVVSVELNRASRYMAVDGTFDLEAVVLPLNATNQTVTYESGDDTIATVTVADGVCTVTAKAVGTTEITVTTEDGGYTDVCTVTVSDELIMTSVFTADRANSYLTGMAIGTTVEDIVLGIDNVDPEIIILDTNGEQVTGVPVSTGFTIRLMIAGEIADELTILIEGDVSPNGALDIIDYTLVRLHILNIRTMEGFLLDAADVNDNGVIDIIDYTLIRLHILDIRSLYE